MKTNKTHTPLLAFAALSAFCSASVAQSSVTIYGTLDASVRHLSNAASPTSPGTPAGAKWSVEGASASNGNRLGFMGVEDLGGGLNAHFTLEAGLNADTGAMADASSFFNRTSLVGLGGSWGALDLGRQYSVGFKTAVSYDPLWGKYASMNSAIGLQPGSLGAGCLPMQGGACARFSNDIQYTGSFGPVTLRAEYAPGEQAGGGGNGSATAVGVGYNDGTLAGAAAYTQQKTMLVAPAATLPGYPGTPSGARKNAYTVGGSYTKGALRVTLGYNKDATATNGADTVLRTAWGGLNYQVTPLLWLTAAYYQSKLSSVVSATRPDGQEKARTYLLEARYFLSKRTSIYTEFDNTQWGRGISFVPTATPNIIQTGISAGITHTF